MTKPDNGATVLSIRDLTKVFLSKHEQVRALDRVSLDVRRGELFTLLGPSGCGKTTTLRCIAGFEQPTGGSIAFHGRDYTSLPPFRRNIGMVFQSYALFPHMSIFENVAYGLRIRRLPGSEIEERVDRIIRLWDWKGPGSGSPASSREGSSSGSPWPGPWSTTPSCCCWTSR